MGRTTLLFTVLLLTAALPLIARPQQQESLGDVARQLRDQHDKGARKATKVFTNDNLPEPKPGEAISIQATNPDTPAKGAQGSSQPAISPSETTGKPPESPAGKDKTRDYWQGKFKAARLDVAKAKEHQQLAEDELNLLQIQQAREMDTTGKADLTAKVQAKQSEVDTNKAATDAAQKALDDLEKDFKASGAPDDWRQTD
jgi:hypothetical protein